MAALRGLLGNDEHAAWVHFGATTQDVMDTGLVLRLREVCTIVEARLQLLLGALADLAERHAELPLAARTRRLPATPTSFGAIAAAWGAPLLAERESLQQIRRRLLRASLHGASGNASALGPRAAELRRAFAAELELAAADISWHTDRSVLVEWGSGLTRICGLLAKIAEDCLFAAAPEVGELKTNASGASSTMPHKKNPVAAETIVSLFDYAAALETALTRALLHRQPRDGAAWMLEWQALPQLFLCCGRALQLTLLLLTELEPDPARMRANLDGEPGLAYAEAISFRLAEQMPRPEAQALVKQACADAVAQKRALVDLVAAQFPEVEWRDIVDPLERLGDAPAQALEFVRRVRAD